MSDPEVPIDDFDPEVPIDDDEAEPIEENVSFDEERRVAADADDDDVAVDEDF